MLSELLEFLKESKKNNEYSCLAISLKGYQDTEYILISPANVDKKLEYYPATYNEDGTHKYNDEVRIISFGHFIFNK